MVKILFVCHGNICRSPSAEYIMKELVKKADMEDSFYIASAATSWGNVGSPVYPNAKEMLEAHGIDCSAKRSIHLEKSDYDKYDFIIGMDRANIRDMKKICGGDPQGKMYRLLQFAGEDRDLADPWYTRDFQTAWDDLVKGCNGLMRQILQTRVQTENTARA